MKETCQLIKEKELTYETRKSNHESKNWSDEKKLSRLERKKSSHNRKEYKQDGKAEREESICWEKREENKKGKWDVHFTVHLFTVYCS